MDLNGLLRRAVDLGASDIHLKIGRPPVVRRDGSLVELEGVDALDDDALTAVLNRVAEHAPEKLSHFHSAGDLDIAYQDEDLPRFRVTPGAAPMTRSAGCRWPGSARCPRSRCRCRRFRCGWRAETCWRGYVRSSPLAPIEARRVET